MNQNRWTCLTTALLALVSPQAAVWAQALPSVPAVPEHSSVPISPQSQPIVTPLEVTELQVEAAVPVAAPQPVPAVSKLPIVAKVAKPAQPQRIASTSIAKAKADSVPVFDPNARATAPIISVPIDSVEPPTPSITPVAPIPQVSSSVTSLPQQSNTVNATVTTNIPSNPASSAIATNESAPAAAAPVEIAPTVANPQAEGVRQNPDIPGLESGMPQYIFAGERPQQLVATAIAQVDGEIAAPEPSIAIPVDRPKQSTVPGASTATPATTVPITSVPQSNVPNVPAIPGAVAPKLEPRLPASSATAPKLEPKLPASVEPGAIDKVIATHRGKASWYGSGSGSRTANGERYNPSGMTAAHRHLPFGTNVRVTNLRTGKTVTVRINDRGPFIRGRIIDLSAAAADAIDLKSAGIADVKVEVMGIQGYALLQEEE